MHVEEYVSQLNLIATDEAFSEQDKQEAARILPMAQKCLDIEDLLQTYIVDATKTIDDFNLAIAELPNATP